jgi:hypothetical protein
LLVLILLVLVQVLVLVLVAELVTFKLVDWVAE